MLKIEKLVYVGAGAGFVGRMPVFVPMTVPGDEIEYKIKRKHAGYIEGELVRVVKPSPNRVVPKCKYFGECGGCQWQHMDYAAQILWKQLIVEEQLRRIGKIAEPNVLPTIPSPKIWNYRNRVKLHKDKKGRVGFYAAGSHRVIEVDECAIAPPPFILPLEGGGIKGGGESFTQINSLQNKNLQNLVVSLVKEAGAKTVLELYCGNGNLTFPVAEIVDEITATDSDRRAIDNATHVVRPELVEGRPACSWFVVRQAHDELTTNGRITFICQSAKTSITPPFSKGGKGGINKKFDCVLLDPPRDGCKEIIPGLVRLKPQNIIYVSCNPSTLARDVRQLTDSGYILKSTQPIDMFPQTYHIEIISELVAKWKN